MDEPTQPAQPSQPPAPAELDPEQRLMATIADLDELRAQAAEREPAELDPVVVALLDRLSGGPDASLEAQSLHRRVASGALSWRDFWRAPQDHPGGVALWHQVQRARLQVSVARGRGKAGQTNATPTEAS